MNYTPKRVAPALLAYFIAFLYIAIGVLVIMAILTFLKGNNLVCLIELGVVGFILAFLLFCSSFFSWVCLASLMPYKNMLKYVTHDIISVSGNNETTYTIREITEIKKIGKAYRLTGSFFIKEPLTAEKHKTVITLRYYTEEMIERLKEFQNDNLHSRED